MASPQPGIPTSNILQPGGITVQGGANWQLISDLQALTPQYYNRYVEKYGNEDYTWWLNAYGGMEQVYNREYFWFENRGKNMFAVGNLNAVVAPAAGATVTVTIADGYYDSGTYNPIRAGETVRIASSNIEGEVLTVDDSTPSAFTATIRPKISTQAFVSAGSANLLAGEILLLAGDMDAGEASDSIDPQVHLDIKYTNTITEMRETWQATDLAEMTQVYYNTGVSGDIPPGGDQAGTSYYTLKGLKKSNTRYKNNVEFKLIRGNVQNNTGLSNSFGAQGLIPAVQERGETITYTPGDLGISKIHEITRIMDVNGCATDNMWLMDIFQRQQFSDSIFREYPAGAYVWGSAENSQEAAVNFGVETFRIDGYMFKAKKYKPFNTEYTTGRTPLVDYFRNYGLICPQGTTTDARDSSKTYKNVSLMFQAPVGGGTVGNGIRVWRHGGASMTPTTGKMDDYVEQITYRSLRLCAANQFLQVTAD